MPTQQPSASAEPAATRPSASAFSVEAENVRLLDLIDRTAAHWLALVGGDKPIAWEGAIDAAMEAACNEIRRLREGREGLAELAALLEGE